MLAEIGAPARRRRAPSSPAGGDGVPVPAVERVTRASTRRRPSSSSTGRSARGSRSTRRTIRSRSTRSAARSSSDRAATIEELNVGVYHSYSTGPGDQVNNLINPNIFAHPKLVTAAQTQNGQPTGPKDDRVTRKMVVVPDDEAGGASGITSNVKFTIYGTPETRTPSRR